MRYSDCKKKLILQCLAIIFISCSSPEKVQIDKLDGYWEIEFIYQDGEKFIPKVSKIIFDHYQIQYPKGYLNKVTLELNDSFNTSKDMTFFEIEKKNAKYYINYKSRWDEWKSKINFLDSQKLILEIGNRTFHYKRPKIKL
tara:strand:+ start:11977 stop:12399 length:423 start_codon:yes stop_codon:yes gene_type:complete